MASYLFADDFVLETGTTFNFYREFLKGLVHKSNNQIGIVQGFGSLILFEDDLDPAVRENVEQMDAAGRQMSELNKKVLTAGGCARLSCVSTNISPMMNYLEDKAKQIASQSGDNITLDFRAEPDLADVIIDQTRFNEIYEELVKNAAESAAVVGPNAVSIEFGVSSPGRVDLFIRNSAPELDETRLKGMFECFHGSKGNDHIGIGLPLSAVLCGQMGIRLGVQSKGPQVSVWLSLPTS